MSTEENKAVVARAYQGINDHDMNIFDELVAEDCVEHEVLPGAPDRGPEAPKAAFTTFLSSFPDLRMEVEDVIAEGDKVAVRCTMSGTHGGDFMGTPATNKSFSVQVIDVFSIRDGQIAEHWGASDEGSMLTQLGLMPEQ